MREIGSLEIEKKKKVIGNIMTQELKYSRGQHVNTLKKKLFIIFFIYLFLHLHIVNGNL